MKTTTGGVLIALVLGLTAACGGSNEPPKGPAEKAGEKVDDAASDTKDAAKKAGDKVEEKADDAKEEVHESTKD
jgi:outer membrane murein-binding lipoprotein Lpp